MTTAVNTAFVQGSAALDEGDLVRARELLEYAHRREPENGTVALTLACVRMQQDDATAVDLLRHVTSRNDVRDAWHSLAAFQHRTGLSEPAARDLARLLARHTPLPDPDAQATYDAIARQTGAPGWSGVTAAGMLVISLSSSVRPMAHMLADLAIDLDGRPLEARPGQAAGRASCWLPVGWQQGCRLQVSLAGRALIGSPYEVAVIARTEGVIWSRDGGLEGWAWMPGDPDLDPIISIRSVDAPHRLIRIVAVEPWTDLANHAPLARPRRLHVPAADLASLPGVLEVLGTDSRRLYGAPLDPAQQKRIGAHRPQARPLVPAGFAETTAPLLAPPRPVWIDITAPRRGTDITAPRRGVDIVIPVHGGLDMTLACLRQVRATLENGARIVVIDDASPDPELAAALDRQAREGVIVLERLPHNQGFPTAANAGMRLGPDRDVVLLNNDTLLPEGWLQRLQDAAYSAADIGTVTPLSNNATILSYPSPRMTNAVPSAAEVVALDAAAQAANPGVTLDIPTAVGFCMYVRRDCLDAVGPFRTDLFAQGYGEENDFCLRAHDVGWRHVALAGLYVGHIGGQSFSAARQHLLERNLRILNRLHPGYAALIDAFEAAAPLAAARRRMDEVRWSQGRCERGAVILVGHAAGGGVRRRLLERCAEIRDAGLRPILLLPGPPSSGPVPAGLPPSGPAPEGTRRAGVSEADIDAYPNLTFAMPQDQEALVALLRAERPTHVELHHWIGHDPGVFDLAGRLGIPGDVVVHDYSWFCPRVTLTNPEGRYCGEPPVAQCEACVRAAGGRVEEDITPTALRQRSRAVLERARKVVAPSRDTARRMARQFDGLACQVEEPEDNALIAASPRPPRRPGEMARVCVVGAISLEKGYNYLLSCARDVADRGLPIRFSVVGFTCDDEPLLATGVLSITGPYEEAEATALIRAQGADVGFLPACWPETWSYTLSQMWQAGLDVLVFDLGAPAERVTRGDRGLALPLGLPPQGFNDLVLRVCRPDRQTG